jgi:uncharacterized Zn-binding protein involved in type VI secretion
MPFANPNYTDLIVTTMRNRSKDIQDNVTKNNALLSYIRKKGNLRKIDGGIPILESIMNAENPNFGWYSGYDLLPTATADVISAAEFDLKQASVQVVISGRDELINSGEEKIKDLLKVRMKAAEAAMVNGMSAAIYGDGTAYGGKVVVGLDAAVPVDPTTGVYGGIDRAAWPFWRPQVLSPGLAITAANIAGYMNTLWLSLIRGTDKPDLIVCDNYMYSAYWNSLQQLQRFTSRDKAGLGFESLDYCGADVIADGGQGGYAVTKTMYFLNTNYLYFRPHKDRDMVPLEPKSRVPVNQDAEVVILGWAGAMTCSNQRLQGRLISA